MCLVGLVGAVLNIVLSIVCFKNDNAKIGAFLLVGGLVMLGVFFTLVTAKWLFTERGIKWNTHY